MNKKTMWQTIAGQVAGQVVEQVAESLTQTPPSGQGNDAVADLRTDKREPARDTRSDVPYPPVRAEAPQPVPNKWLAALNPLDWFPSYGTYISMGAAAALYAADMFGYQINPSVYGILAAFAGARLRRGMERPVQPRGNYYG